LLCHSNLWFSPTGWVASKGEPYASYRLTNFIEEAVRHVFPSQVDNSIIFFADHRGTENFQIYKIDDAFHSWPESITQNPKVRHEWGSECFSHDGKYIVYGSNEENPSNMLVHVMNMKHKETSCVTNKEGWCIPGYWSPDNKKLYCSQITTLTDYDIWLLDIENNEMVQITPLKDMTEKKADLLLDHGL
jgi:Tol biopolymer transport system component